MDTVEIIYRTADGKRIRVEVTIPVRELLEQSDRQIRSQRRQDRRYLVFAEFSEEALDSSLSTSHENMLEQPPEQVFAV